MQVATLLAEEQVLADVVGPSIAGQKTPEELAEIE